MGVFRNGLRSFFLNLEIMKLKYSALLSDARGTLGGSVATRSRYGSVLRNKANPIDRKTEAQQRIRGIFAMIARRWRIITAECRQEWRDYALRQPYTDIFGDERYLQGNAKFIQTNMNLYLAGFDMLDCPDASFQEFFPMEPILDPPSHGQIWVTIPQPQLVKIRYNIYATPPHSVGAVNVKGDLVFIRSVSGTELVNDRVNIAVEYEELFGDIKFGSDITIGVVQVSSTGRTSLLRTATKSTDFQTPQVTSFEYRPLTSSNNFEIKANIINAEILKAQGYRLRIAVQDHDEFCMYVDYGISIGNEEALKVLNGEWGAVDEMYAEEACITLAFSVQSLADFSDKVFYRTSVNYPHLPDDGPPPVG